MTGPARPPQVHFEHIAAPTPAGLGSIVVRDSEGRAVGQFDYQICHPCRQGHVEGIAVAAPWQGRGVARRTLHTALGPCAGYAWSTSRQSTDGRGFFTAMEEETGQIFPGCAPPCPHMLAAHPTGLVRGLLTRSRL
ncbi:GNAT family N-acetyltransferase [Streptomyces sp. NBC_01558]|uniref:GNAT family N-acetyltransferase n=1 Tax=Streptomyces sp. NBC_01558 TaxID=2975878 RepID=UPI002DD96A04|nr:GNAT family N-acetyltransferase [Streptomyces sp. NBC_01558]WSD75033.1 GNAT family N-acetyltransferase [Streptomyces sp. NBC_01558]